MKSCNSMFPASIRAPDNIIGRKDAKYTSTDIDKRS